MKRLLIGACQVVAMQVSGLSNIVRGVAACPREWLLVRGHHQWVGLLPLAIVGFDSVVGLRDGIVFRVVAVAAGVVSFGSDVVGSAAHTRWSAGRLWQGIECPCCGAGDDGDDDGPDDDDVDGGPDGPEDHGIAVEAEQWLADLTSNSTADADVDGGVR